MTVKIVGVFGRPVRDSFDSFSMHDDLGCTTVTDSLDVFASLARCNQRLDRLPEVGEMLIPEDTPPPKYEAWINVYSTHWGNLHPSRDAADRLAMPVPDRVGLLHIWTDGDGDNPQVERVPP